MKRYLLVLLLAAALLETADVSAQTIGQLLDAAPAGSAVDAGESEFEIQAATDDTSATIKASRTTSDGDFFHTQQLSASAPLGTGGGATDIAAWSGFPDAFTVTGKYTGYWARGTRRSGADVQTGPGRGLFDAVCAAVRRRAQQRGVSADDAAKLECDSGNVDQYAPHLLLIFDALFWDESKAHIMWGATATIGHRVFEYVPTTELETTKATRTPKGVSAYAAVIPPDSQMLLTAGAEYRNKYTDAETETICPPTAGSDNAKCTTGPFGEPTDVTQKVLYAEMRRHFGSRALFTQARLRF